MPGFNPEVFRWARETAGLEQAEAAHAIGIVPVSLAAIESGEKEPSRSVLLYMARAYRRSLLTLYSRRHRVKVTVETAEPKKQRQNRKIPDVCTTVGVPCCNPFEFTRALGFRTQWKQETLKTQRSTKP